MSLDRTVCDYDLHGGKILCNDWPFSSLWLVLCWILLSGGFDSGHPGHVRFGNSLPHGNKCTDILCRRFVLCHAIVSSAMRIRYLLSRKLDAADSVPLVCLLSICRYVYLYAMYGGLLLQCNRFISRLGALRCIDLLPDRVNLGNNLSTV